ncbi:GatB/YqeY domain-containing protein [Fundicoccus culcitae]|uniref:GatB/YqeY domain-containing protein n=1 Tax=Fundicoccus culcitae TaxID=2969821 RepID=A0ABY5P7D3_9LACT|nr:GatB/YqeY domain-containing protein [Fundicoccus culcitae]UUX34353.1 GatB/YqeY domain-containing protein [Fundicoccus culcitae]
MTLTEQINQDVKQAMKARDKDTLKVIRMLKAALQLQQIEQKDPLSTEQEISIIARELKQRKESLAEFDKAGRHDLVEELEKEIKIVEQYLPKQLSEDEINVAIDAIITATGASSMKDFGTVMSQTMTELKGQADGQTVNRLVKERLSNN